MKEKVVKADFVKLSEKQIDSKIDYIKNYMEADTAADAATFDANANVSTMNIATMASKIHDDINIQVNRQLIYDQLKETFSAQVANKYLEQLDSHLIYCHDETSLLPYCVSLTMYPFLMEGLVNLGGESKAPKHLESYCGGFVNLVFAIASQFAGAVATVEFLMHFDHFASKDYGEDYLKTNTKTINNHLQHVVYALNQPAAARGFQCVFWNISLFDEHYFKALFDDFVYPNGVDVPSWERISKLQDHFMEWMNGEREKCLLTFPVITSSLLTDGEKPRDEEYARKRAQNLADGNSFFNYSSDTADSLSSCCRLRNEFDKDNRPVFSYSLGAGGVATGSTNVITLNMNRLEQEGINLKRQIQLMHKFQIGHRKVLEKFKDSGLLTAYDGGYISLEKQFLTIGVNGIVEAAEFNGIDVGFNEEYKEFMSTRLKTIYDENRKAKKRWGYMFNTEFVPAENLGVKFAQWDKDAGMYSPRECYNSYFYAVEDDSVSSIDKFKLHGNEFAQWLDGGSAYHLNLEEHLDAEQYYQLMCVAAKTGCPYWTTNVLRSVCNTCGFIDKGITNRS